MKFSRIIVENNLKVGNKMDEKILDEEIMSDDELDNVAGGSFDELKADAQALQSELPVGIKLSRPSGIGNMRIYDRDAVIEVFRKYGVTVNFDLKGNKVSRNEAIAHTKAAINREFPNN